MTYAELDKEVSKKAKEFARNMKKVEKEEVEETAETKEEDKEEKVENKLNFSISPFGAMIPSYDFSKNLSEDSTLDSIIKNSNVKVKK